MSNGSRRGLGFWIGTGAALAVACCMASSAPAQTTWYVDDDAPNDPGPGDPLVSDPNEDGSTAHPFDAIQEGIDAASNGDTVEVLNGTYTGQGNKDLDFGARAITVQSEHGPDDCIVDCKGNGRAFWFHSSEEPNSVVEGFTIRNGSADYGGAIKCENDSNPIVANCTFEENSADNAGGAMYSYVSSPTVTDCTFTNNQARNAGPRSSPTTSMPNLSATSPSRRLSSVHCSE